MIRPRDTARTDLRYYITRRDAIDVFHTNIRWTQTPPPVFDFVQWLDTKQSQQAKDHVEREARSARERWQRMLHHERMQEKRKKDQEDIRKRMEEVDRQEVEEHVADREMK
jgi:hypothetical protein